MFIFAKDGHSEFVEMRFFIDPLPNPIGIFYLKLRSIYRTVYMLTDLCQR